MTHGAEDELPRGWEQTTLGEAFRWRSGGTPTRTRSEFYGGEIPWAIIGDLADGVVAETATSITSAGLEASSAKWVPPNAVLVAMYGSIGKLGIAGKALTTNQAIAFTDPPPEVPRYLFYYLLSIRSELIRRGKGGTQRNISQTVLKAVPFIRAPVSEQHTLVSALDSYFSRLDDAVANLERVQRNLKRYRASVLKAAVEGRLVPTEAELARAEGRDYELASVLLERILAERRRRWEEAELEKMLAKGKPPKNDKWKAKYTEPAEPDLDGLPELPEGWCWATVDQVSAQVEYGTSSKTSSDSSGVPVLRMGNIVAGVLDLSDLKFLPQDHDEFPRLILEDGDVVFNRTNSPELVGKSAVYRGVPARASFASYLIRVQLLSGLVPEYFAAVLNSPYGREWVARVRTQQVGQANVNGTKLKKLAVPLPPSGEQERACAALALHQSVLENVDQGAARSARRIHALRQSILARAFSGQLAGEVLAEALVGAGEV